MHACRSTLEDPTEPSPALAALARSRLRGHGLVEVIEREPLDVLRAGGEWTYVVGALSPRSAPLDGLAGALRIMDAAVGRGLCLTAVERSWPAWLLTRWLMFSPESILGAEAALLEVRQGLTRHEMAMAVESTGLLYLDHWYDLWGRVTLAGERRDL